MLSTLGEAKASTLANIAGVPTTSTDFTRYVNEATSRLLRKGDFSGTLVPMYFCVYKGCVVMPRYVGQIRKINWCMHTPTKVNNMYWDFLVNDWGSMGDYGRTGSNFWHPWASGTVGLTNQGYTAVAQNIMGTGRLLRCYPQCDEDVGQTLTFFGIDNNGQELKTNNEDGTYSKGITVTLASGYGSSSVYVSRIDRVLKDVTQCPVDVFAYDATNDLLEEVAHYDSSETNPKYRKYRLSGGMCGSAWDGCLKGVLALVKLAFVPVSVDNDLVLIQNLDALKDMMQSIRFAESGDAQSALIYEARAVRELNRELENDNPEELTPVVDHTFGGMAFRNHCF